MSASCGEAVSASDIFQFLLRKTNEEDVKITFGGTARPPQDDDYSDILTSQEITARAFDLLDDPPTR